MRLVGDEGHLAFAGVFQGLASRNQGGAIPPQLGGQLCGDVFQGVSHCPRVLSGWEIPFRPALHFVARIGFYKKTPVRGKREFTASWSKGAFLTLRLA
jgi:hypothetical protein